MLLLLRKGRVGLVGRLGRGVGGWRDAVKIKVDEWWFEKRSGDDEEILPERDLIE